MIYNWLTREVKRNKRFKCEKERYSRQNRVMRCTDVYDSWTCFLELDDFEILARRCCLKLKRRRIELVSCMSNEWKHDGRLVLFFCALTRAYASTHVLKISFMLSCVMAEHSMYLYALIFWRNSSPSRVDMCRCLTVSPGPLSALLVVLLVSRKSHCVPTSTMRTPGMNLFSSGSHFVTMLSIESGRTTLKHNMITSVSGYAIILSVSQSSFKVHNSITFSLYFYSILSFSFYYILHLFIFYNNKLLAILVKENFLKSL